MQSDQAPLDAFSAWTWVPTTTLRARGFSTARLLLFPRRFVVIPRSERLGRLLDLPASIDYEWPAVVIERQLPTLQAGVLVDIDGRLGRVIVRPPSGRRLAAALRAAGFAVIDVKRWGWEAPHQVSKADLNGYVDQVPASVVAP